jgi:hypothetical protein
VALVATLRVAAPLVGAALDVIATKWFSEGTDPMAVSAQASISFALFASPGPCDLTRVVNLADGGSSIGGGSGPSAGIGSGAEQKAKIGQMFCLRH